MPTSLSPAKLAANRANALKSTGPRTPQGKHRSSRNALTHGLSPTTPFSGDPTGHASHLPPAPSPLLPTEDPALYASFRTALLSDLSPQTPLELDLADRIVSLHWRLRRCPAIEAELAHRHVERRRQSHEAQQDQRYVKTRDRAPFAPPPAVEFLANQFASLDDRANPLARLHRYETSLDRTLRRCLTDYRTLQLTRQARDDDDEDLDAPADEDTAPHEELPTEPTPAAPSRGTGDPPVLPEPEFPNEPTAPSRRGDVSPPSSPPEQNEPKANAPSNHDAASVPSVPLWFNPSPDLQNEPTLDSPPSLTKLSPRTDPLPTKDG